MASRLKKVGKGKWPGVYCYESNSRKHNGKNDVCYYITFKIAGKKTTEKIGWLSEGYSPQVASELRANRVRTGRHGKTVKTARQIRIEKIKHDQTLAELKKPILKHPVTMS